MERNKKENVIAIIIQKEIELSMLYFYIYRGSIQEFSNVYYPEISVYTCNFCKNNQGSPLNNHRWYKSYEVLKIWQVIITITM